MKQSGYKNKSPLLEQKEITGGEQHEKAKKAKKGKEAQEGYAHMKEKEEMILEIRGLDQEVTQGVITVMKKQPPQSKEDTLSEKGRDPRLHYQQSLMETEIL